MRPAASGRRLLALACVCVAGSALLAGGCGSDSSPPRPRAGFWGVVPQSKTGIERLRRLKRGGIDSVRIGIDWRAVMPTEDGAPRWEDVDGIVGDAARAGMFVLPYVYRSPGWVAPDENELPVRTAGQRRSWMAFLEDVVGRYGPGGAFWKQHPDLPERPIRTWQIWNEPNFFYFASEPDPGRYARLVRISHSALAASDPGAKLMLGGMFALPGERPPQAYPAYRFLELMFARYPGLREIVDGVALHPYTQDFRNLSPILDQVRRAPRRNGSGRCGG